MRKQIGIKFEDEDLARWDLWAESHGLTRTTLIETAVERFISASQEQLPEEVKQIETGGVRPSAEAIEKAESRTSHGARLAGALARAMQPSDIRSARGSEQLRARVPRRSDGRPGEPALLRSAHDLSA